MSVQGTDPLVGRTVDGGRYRIDHRLARGGMSTVYSATDLRLERTVAVKVLYPHFADEPANVARFRAEALNAARLSHPHVVQVLDQGVEDDGTAYLVMEYVRGRTLRDVLREQGALPPRQALALLDPVAEGLAAAHEAGLVHRDIKPENVLLGDRGEVKLADFGLSRAATNHTSTGTRMGTAAYLAPELALNAEADARSDIYSLGIVLYELLTGRQPFTGDSDVAIALRHVNETVPPPSRAVPGLPADLDELVECCTAREPDQRPHDAADLLDDLRHIRTTLTDEELDLAPGPRRGGAAAASHTSYAPAPPGEDARDDDGGGRRPGYGAVAAAAGATTVLGAAGATRAMPPQVPAAAPAPGPAPGKRTAKALQRQARRQAQQPRETLGRRPSRARAWVLGTLFVLLTALAAGAAWFFGAGPGAAVDLPRLGGQSAQRAATELSALGVDSTQRQVFHDTTAEGLVVGMEPAGGTTIRRFEDVRLLVSKGPQLFAVPDLQGRQADAAARILAGSELEAGRVDERYDESVPAGRVISQDPAPDERVRRGTAVDYAVSLGPAPVDVPDVTGLPADEARAALEEAGLKPKDGGKEFSRTVPKGAVTAQSPAGGTAERGSVVTYTVSKGPRMVEVPDVTRQQLDEARRTLEEAGFTVEVVESPWGIIFGTVATQSPSGGKAPEGSTVTLRVV